MPRTQTAPPPTAAQAPPQPQTEIPRQVLDLVRSRERQLRAGAWDTADRIAHAPLDLVRHAVSSVVVVNVDVNVDVDVASRATRAIEEAQPASARG